MLLKHYHFFYKKFVESLYMPVNLQQLISPRLSYTSCKQYTSTEDSSSILQLPVSESIQSSLNSYLMSNLLSGENAFFCHICSSNNQARADHKICKMADYLIIQVKRFFAFHQAVT